MLVVVIERVGVVVDERQRESFVQFLNAALQRDTRAKAQGALDFVERGLILECTQRDLRVCSERLLEHLAHLIQEVMVQAGTTPDVVYLTGGMARAQVVRTHLEQICKGPALIDSDHFTSVTQGLALWASRIFATA